MVLMKVRYTKKREIAGVFYVKNATQLMQNKSAFFKTALYKLSWRKNQETSLQMALM